MSVAGAAQESLNHLRQSDMTKFNSVSHNDCTCSSLDEPRFPTAQCDALFAAVLAHDAIDMNATLPDAIHLNYTPEQLTQCYRICRQLWKDGVSREALVGIVEKIYHQRALNAEDQLLFKYLRANIKHLRFAYAAGSAQHRYPRMFHWMTGVLGSLQDAFKNNQSATVNRVVILARLVLSPPLYRLTEIEIDRFRPSSTNAFQAYFYSQIAFIRAHLSKQKVTSKEFHEIRKTISRQVALYDNLKILFPSEYHWQVSRYLGSINGLMGNMHDELIARKFDKSQDYYADTFEIPEEIRLRLTTVTASFSALQVI